MNPYKPLSTLILSILVLVSVLLAIALDAKPAFGAERIYFQYGPLLFPLSVESLDRYADDGKITTEFARYASRFKPQELVQLRQMLKKRFEMDEVAVDRMTDAVPVVKDFLTGLGETIETPSGLNGFHAMRSALVLTAADTHGSWTLLDVIHHVPTDIRIDTQRAMNLYNMASLDSTSCDR
jgi:hypothetical protein